LLLLLLWEWVVPTLRGRQAPLLLLWRLTFRYVQSAKKKQIGEIAEEKESAETEVLLEFSLKLHGYFLCQIQFALFLIRFARMRCYVSQNIGLFLFWPFEASPLVYYLTFWPLSALIIFVLFGYFGYTLCDRERQRGRERWGNYSISLCTLILGFGTHAHNYAQNTHRRPRKPHGHRTHSHSRTLRTRAFLLGLLRRFVLFFFVVFTRIFRYGAVVICLVVFSSTRYYYYSRAQARSLL